MRNGSILGLSSGAVVVGRIGSTIGHDQRESCTDEIGDALEGLPAGIPALYDDLQPLQPTEPTRHLVRDFRALTGPSSRSTIWLAALIVAVLDWRFN